MSNILKGIRVLDITQAYSGPLACFQLADQGADVIKVESLYGDQGRLWAPFKNGYSGYYIALNRNKRGISVDLKTPEGFEILSRLIKESDVVVENFKVGSFAKMGFTYEYMKELNPQIIYGNITGFGLEGPMAHRPCYDIVTQAECGIMSMCGETDGDPVKIGVSISDAVSGMYLALGISMALYKRALTGEGSRIDVSMLDSMFSFLEGFVPHYTMSGESPFRTGNAALTAPPWDSFHAKDGMFVVGCGTEAFWQKFVEVMERPDIGENPKYRTIDDRHDHYVGDLKDIIEEWSVQKTLDELEEKIVAAGIPFGRVRSVGECAELPQIQMRNMLWKIYDPGVGEEVGIAGTPIKFHGEPDDIRMSAPMLGQHTDEVLTTIAGFTLEEVNAMREKGVIK